MHDILLIDGSLLPLLMERAGERRILRAHILFYSLTLPSPARRGDIVLRAE